MSGIMHEAYGDDAFLGIASSESKSLAQRPAALNCSR
jgi:hypothetical protein